MKQPVLALLCGVVVAAWPAGTHAAPIQFTQTFVADYEFNILGGTSLNPGPATGFIPFRAIGDLTFQLDPGINNPALTTVPFVNMTGSLPGVPPSPPFTLPHAISPNLEFIGGQLTNIVRDSNGNVTSADVVNLESRWALTTPGFTLYTKVGLPFNATGVTIPFAEGTVLAGAAEFNVYFQGTDELIAVGRNRTLTAVPEPSGLALVGLAAATLGGYFGRGRRGRR